MSLLLRVQVQIAESEHGPEEPQTAAGALHRSAGSRRDRKLSCKPSFMISATAQGFGTGLLKTSSRMPMSFPYDTHLPM